MKHRQFITFSLRGKHEALDEDFLNSLWAPLFNMINPDIDWAEAGEGEDSQVQLLCYPQLSYLTLPGGDVAISTSDAMITYNEEAKPHIYVVVKESDDLLQPMLDMLGMMGATIVKTAAIMENIIVITFEHLPTYDGMVDAFAQTRRTHEMSVVK